MHSINLSCHSNCWHLYHSHGAVVRWTCDGATTNCANDDEMHRDHDRCPVPNDCDGLAMAEWMNDGDATCCATTNAIVAIANVIVAATIGTQLSSILAYRSRAHRVQHNRRRVHV